MGEFRFKQFNVDDYGCGMKVCSDSVLLGAWFLPPLSEAKSVLDVGTGSGILALMAAQECPDASILAIDIDSESCMAAEKNFNKSPWVDRLRIVQSDFSKYIIAEKQDIIICNPPYFTNGALAKEHSRATARHQKGLGYESLIEKSAQILNHNGHLGLISPAEFENDIIFHAEFNHLKLRRLLRIQTSTTKPATRLLWDFSFDDCSIEIQALTLRDKDGNITSEYRQLVDNYYIKI